MTFEAKYLGSNGWLIKFDKTNLLIDPWLTGDLVFPPGCLLYTSPSPRD